jgi:hypothetical protein
MTTPLKDPLAHRAAGRSAATLPVPSDVRLLRARLAGEERGLLEKLAGLESSIRRFEDVERPAYATWRRLEFGPLLATLEDLADELRARRATAERVADLVDRDGLHPREALHVVLHPSPCDPRSRREHADRDEVEARRRARLERKRAERREAKRAATQPAAAVASGAAARGSRTRARVVGLYRGLARRLHPDSHNLIRALAPDRRAAIWLEVQGAYVTGSLDRLLAISTWIEASGEECAADGSFVPGLAGSSRLSSLSERYDRLRALRRSCQAVERRLAEIAADPAWDFAASRPHTRRKKAQQARRAIEEETHRVRRELEEIAGFFDSIGRPRPPRSARGR